MKKLLGLVLALLLLCGCAAQTPTAKGTADPRAGKDAFLTDPVPEGRPEPVEPQETEVTDAAYTCTISISCATILDNMDDLDPEKAELVPADGWLLQPVTVTFQAGESVFDVLVRICREQNIHMEYVNTPMYNSAYIEGIGNLYEFDCGNLSGWMYQVNEWFPNYGCSRYALTSSAGSTPATWARTSETIPWETDGV